MEYPLHKRAVAEALGTGILVAAVIGSGIMADRLSAGNTAIALLANTIATGAVLIALILTFGPISGAHFNPAVSIADAVEGGLDWRASALYAAGQITGGCAGAVLAHAMFALPLVTYSRHARTGFPQLLSEFVASFGLLAVIWGCSRFRAAAVPFAVAAYITSAYWFTASTSFANPAVTIARSLSDTFAGIRPVDVLPFIGAQITGALAATLVFRWFKPISRTEAREVVVPHSRASQEPVV
jgi:glycerol uptake facilitator-like aquaporin